MALARSATTYEELTHTALNTIDTNAAACVARTDTQTGSKHVPAYLVAPPYNGSEALPWSVFAPIYVVTGGVYKFAGSTNTATTGIAAHAVWQLDLPNGHTLTSVRVRVLPAAGHTAAPAVLPRVKLFSRPYNSETVTVLATATHTWTSTAVYHAGFQLTASSATGTTIAATSTGYFFSVRNESGSNSKKAMQVLLATVRVAVDTSSGSAAPSFSFWV
jgi:hypothetical protein